MFLIILAIIMSIIAVVIIPKKIKLSELYATALFADILSAMADIFLDLKYNLYGFFNQGADWHYLPIFLIIYPSVTVLFLNFFPFNRALHRKIIYVLIWSAATLLAEIASLQTAVFYYHGWKWWYSACLYPIIYALLYLHVKFLRKLEAV